MGNMFANAGVVPDVSGVVHVESVMPVGVETVETVKTVDTVETVETVESVMPVDVVPSVVPDAVADVAVVAVPVVVVPSVVPDGVAVAVPVVPSVVSDIKQQQYSPTGYKILTPKETKTYYDIVKARLILLYICLIKHKNNKKNNAPGNLFINVLVNNDAVIEPLLREQIYILMSALKIPFNKNKVIKITFHKLLEEFVNKIPKANQVSKLPEVGIRAIITFADVINNTIAPLVSRSPDGEIIAKAYAFIQDLIDKKKSSGIYNLVINSAYIGVPMRSTGHDRLLSGHVTLGFGANKTNYIKNLGTFVTVKCANNIVTWTNSEDSKIYSYIIVKITFNDGTELISHESILVLDGGTDYKLNHKHQQSQPQTACVDIYTGGVEFTSMVLPFNYENKVLLNSDFDNTLCNICHDSGEKFEQEMLKDPKLINVKNLTAFGKMLIDLNIQFSIVTSRTKLSNLKIQQEIEDAMRTLFTNCITISFGSKIRGDDARSELLACDKSSRIMTGAWMVDDIDDVITTIGYGTILTNNGSEATHYHNEKPSEGCVITLGVVGTVGSGKTTFINLLINHLKAILLKDVGEPIDNGTQPIIIMCASDEVHKNENTLPLESVLSQQYPNRTIITIFDTTGADNDLEIPCIKLVDNPDVITPTLLASCFFSISGRQGHPTVDGIFEQDNALTENANSSFKKLSDMNLSEFINHIWVTHGKTQHGLSTVLGAAGQTTKFTKFGDALIVITGYRETKQIFHARWGRQNRNCCFILINDVWILLKSGLEIGAELKPPSVGDDLGDPYANKFDNFQNYIRNCLFTGTDLPEGTCVSAKRDGSLVQISNITTNIETTYGAVLKSNNPFVIMLAQLSYKASGGKSFIIISTNGTLFASHDMWSYILTAFAASLNIVDETLQQLLLHEPLEEFKGLINGYGTDATLRKVLCAWSHIVGDINAREQLFWNEFTTIYPLTENATSQFEAICANRTCCTGKKHTELAAQYKIAMLTFLGVKIGERYIPHYVIEKLLNIIGYKQPLFWNSNDPIWILQLLEGIEKFSMGGYTSDEFFERFPPSNTVMPRFYIIDPEGLILLVKTLCIKGWSYSKLKTLLYYYLHKLRQVNMRKIVSLCLNLPRLREHFPLAGAICDAHAKIVTISANTVLTSIITLIKTFAPVEPAKDSDAKTVEYYKAYIEKILPDFSTPYSPSKDPAIIKWVKFIMQKKDSEIKYEIYKCVLRIYGAQYILDKYDILKSSDLNINSPEQKQHDIIKQNIDDVYTALISNVCIDDITELTDCVMYIMLTIHKT